MLFLIYIVFVEPAVNANAPAVFPILVFFAPVVFIIVVPIVDVISIFTIVLHHHKCKRFFARPAGIPRVLITSNFNSQFLKN